MGTNFYVTAEAPCPHCGRGGEQLHIGKSSGGWCFGLHIIPEMGINSLDDWKIFWQDKKITNEYNDVFSAEEMLSVITKRKRDVKELNSSGYRDAGDMLEKNHACWSPEWGLLRRRIGYSCTGYGDGTWDLINSEFS